MCKALPGLSPAVRQIRKEYAGKMKRLETQQAIARSTAINQTRLKRVRRVFIINIF